MMRTTSNAIVWILASIATACGIAVLILVDLAEDPDSTWLDISFNLIEESPLVILVVAAVLLYGMARRNRYETRQVAAQLASGKREGRRWRRNAEVHLSGLGKAIEQQFGEWRLTRAEREVALLLLKGLSSKEVAHVRATSERTVREQARSIYSKSRLSGRAALSAYFLEDLLAPASTGAPEPASPDMSDSG